MDRAFDDDRQQVLDNALQSRLAAMLLVGFDLETSRAAVALARQLGWARASVGIHPNAAAEHTDRHFAEIRALAQEPEVVAIGETGLDYYRHRTPPDRQRATLDWHLDLAEELRLPVVIHSREAESDTAAALTSRPSSPSPGLLHCFSSTDEGYLDRMLDHGYYISFAGPLTYKSAEPLRAMARLVPTERLLVETDCPYLAPVPRRGKRNEPAFVRYTADQLAETRGVPFETLVEQLWSNSVRLFPALARAAEVIA
jgi:TatD DNase family protein